MAGRRPHRQPLRRSQSDVRLPAGRGVRVEITSDQVGSGLWFGHRPHSRDRAAGSCVDLPRPDGTLGSDLFDLIRPVNASRSCAVIGPGRPVPIAFPSTRTIGTISRVLLVRKASSASKQLRVVQRAFLGRDALVGAHLEHELPRDAGEQAGARAAASAPGRAGRRTGSTGCTRRARRRWLRITASNPPSASACCMASALFSRLFDLIRGFSASGALRWIGTIATLTPSS